MSVAGGGGAGGRAAGQVERGAELAEVAAGDHGGERLLRAVAAGAEDLHLARFDHVDEVAPAALLEDDLARLEVQLLGRTIGAGEVRLRARRRDRRGG